jgi:tripartite ATP-independent transporter DctM subunit
VTLAETLGLAMFVVALGVVMLGFPVAFTLGGVALGFAYLGHAVGVFDLALLGSLPSRFVGVMLNEVLVAVPLFIFMGVMLERSKLAEQLLEAMGLLFGRLRGGLGYAVILVGMLIAASTGIAGAAVVTMGLLSLPAMLRAGYDPRLASGLICASGTLGQIIPPSISLVLLADILQGANTQAQLARGNYAPEPVSVVDLFAGAFLPGMLLVGLYIAWQAVVAHLRPGSSPSLVGADEAGVGVLALLGALAPPAALVVAVLGSILVGIATPTESAAVGAVGACTLAALRARLTRAVLGEVMRASLRITSMVFVILLGASVFSLVFRGFGGDETIAQILSALPGGPFGAMLAVMALMFVLGFFLDFVEIIFVVVPIVGPVLIGMELDPVWLGVMIAINVQTSFLTPPFGFSLFYLRGVAPESVRTSDIYRGVAPFVAIQLAALGIVALFPALATWLPERLFG